MSCKACSAVMGLLAVTIGVAIVCAAIAGLAHSEIPDSECTQSIYVSSDYNEEDGEAVEWIFRVLPLCALVAGLLVLLAAAVQIAGLSTKNRTCHGVSCCPYALGAVLAFVATCLGIFLIMFLNTVCDEFECSSSMTCPTTGLSCGSELLGQGDYCCHCDGFSMYYICQNRYDHLCDTLKTTKWAVMILAAITFLIALVASCVGCTSICFPQNFELDQPEKQKACQPVTAVAIGAPLAKEADA